MSNKVRPIRPSEIPGAKERIFPDEVFNSFNELITQKWCGHRISIMQEDVVNLMIEKGLSKDEIHKNGWLNIEDVYESFGWIVKYYKPGYNEDGQAYFTFIPKEQK